MRCRLPVFLLLSLTGCVSVRQLPLPNNDAIGGTYERARAGDRAAVRQLADANARGSNGLKANDLEAQRLYLQVTEAGDPAAMVALAREKLGKDNDDAEYWFIRAARAGSRSGVDGLRRLYGDSRHGRQSLPVALKWAYVLNSRYWIDAHAKNLGPEQQAEARRQADDWLNRYPLKTY